MAIFHLNSALLRPFRAGNAAALEAVYWHYVALVATVVREGARVGGDGRVLGAPAQMQADLMQETFVRAFAVRARQAYDEKRLYRPYLLTICRNLLVDWARRRGRELSERTLDEAALQAVTDGDTVASIEQQPWADPDTVAIVEAYIAQLDPLLRSVYEQRYVKCVSQVETAQALALTRQRVRTLEDKLRRGLAKILMD